MDRDTEAVRVMEAPTTTGWPFFLPSITDKKECQVFVSYNDDDDNDDDDNDKNNKQTCASNASKAQK